MWDIVEKVKAFYKAAKAGKAEEAQENIKALNEVATKHPANTVELAIQTEAGKAKVKGEGATWSKVVNDYKEYLSDDLANFFVKHS